MYSCYFSLYANHYDFYSDKKSRLFTDFQILKSNKKFNNLVNAPNSNWVRYLSFFTICSYIFLCSSRHLP